MTGVAIREMANEDLLSYFIEKLNRAGIEHQLILKLTRQMWSSFEVNSMDEAEALAKKYLVVTTNIQQNP
jgi:hypothetical protein